MSLENQLIRQGKSQTGQAQSAAVSVASSTRKYLAAILVIAALLRVLSAVYQGNTVTDLPGIYDQISYDGLARRVVEGHGFSFAETHWPSTRGGEPTAHWSYLYTLYLAGVYTLFGPQPLAARLIQAIAGGVLHGWLAWRIGRRLFGSSTGLIAAGLSAVYIYFFYYAGGLLTETFYIVGILWTLDTALRLGAAARRTSSTQHTWQTGHWRLWLELGLAIGLTVLLRQLFLLFVPFLFLWLWWNSSPLKSVSSDQSGLLQRVNGSTIRGLITAAFVVAVLIAPWTVRNYRAFGTFVPLNTNAGFAFFWGNHPIYGTHFVGLLANAETYYNLIPPELRHLNEAELDKALLKRGLEFVSDDPVRYILLSISRSREYFKFWPSSGSGLISNISRVGSFGICIPFILYGLWISVNLLRHPEHPQQRSGIFLLYLFAVFYTTIHLLSWALIRYRLPVDAVLLLFAALGIERLVKRFQLLNPPK